MDQYSGWGKESPARATYTMCFTPSSSIQLLSCFNFVADGGAFRNLMEITPGVMGTFNPHPAIL